MKGKEKDKNKKEAPLEAGDKKKLAIRVLEAKDKLPSGITSLFVLKFPEFEKDKKKLARLNNVLQLRAVDVDITEKLEALVKLVQADIEVEA
jgi:hypothetical protein